MGTAPFNFPPDASLQIGQTLVGNKLALTGSLAQTVFFTAPSDGLYLVAAALRITTTNGVGALAAVFTTPTAGNIDMTDLDPAGPTDGYSAIAPVWMAQGSQLKVTTTATGLTGTTYNVYVAAQRLF